MAAMPASARHVTANGLDHYLVEAGPSGGTPVLLLHGFPDSADLWSEVIPWLARAGCRVIAPDLRGFGRSAAPEDTAAYDIRRKVLPDLAALLDACGIHRAHLVGHDWGAAAAWQFAGGRAERVRSLVAMSVGHPSAFLQGGVAQLARSWYFVPNLIPGLVEWLLPRDDWRVLRRAAPAPDMARRWIADLSRPGRLTAALSWYRANLRLSELLRGGSGVGRIRCPVTGIWSSSETYLTEKQMQFSGGHIEGPWRYRQTSGTHWFMREYPGAVAEMILDHLDWISDHNAKRPAFPLQQRARGSISD